MEERRSEVFTTGDVETKIFTLHSICLLTSADAMLGYKNVQPQTVAVPGEGVVLEDEQSNM